MIVVDVETTGVDDRIHSIVSIGAVDFVHPERRFYGECRMWDGAAVQEEALKVNGFTLEQILDPTKQSLEQLVGTFFAWTRDSQVRTLACHNTFFDHGFLRVSAERYRMPWEFGHRIIDLHSIAWAHMAAHGVEPPVKYNQSAIKNDSLLQYVGLPAEPKPHNGLVGALMEAEALSRLVHGKQLLPEYVTYLVPTFEPQQKSLF
jgi:DNA polymerase III epsilon subunit-like protein